VATPPYLSTSQVAERLAVSLDLVGDLIRRGALEAIDVSPPGSKRATYRISAEAMAEYERNRRVVPLVVQTPVTRRKRKLDGVRRYF
jgi:excisionase family DNA binding protein